MGTAKPPFQHHADAVNSRPTHRNPVAYQPASSPEQTNVVFSRTSCRLNDQAQAKDILVFVHGYNCKFEDAIARAAQITEDMPFHGTTDSLQLVFICGRVCKYKSDAEVAEHQFWNLAEFLAKLRQRVPADTRIHLLAHSMGNRVALRALNALTGNIGPCRTGVHSGTRPLDRKISGMEFMEQQQY